MYDISSLRVIEIKISYKASNCIDLHTPPPASLRIISLAIKLKSLLL